MGAVPQHERLGDGAEELAAGEVHRHQLHRTQARVAVLGRAGREALLVVVRAAERLGHPYSCDALLELGVDGGDGLAGADVRQPGPRLEPHGEGAEDREDGERRQREAGVEGEHDDDDTDARDDAGERDQQALLEQVGQRLDVGRHAGHDPPAHLAIVVVEREPLQVRERSRSQRVQHPLRRPRRRQQLDDRVAPAEQLHTEVQHAHRGEHGPTACADAGIEAMADDHRPDERCPGVDEHQRADGGERPPEAARQPAQAGARVLRRGLGEIDVRVTPQRRQ